MSLMHRAFVENEAGIRRLLARYLPRQQDVEDLAQETFLHGFAAESERDIRAPRAYLYRIAKNLAMNLLSKKSVATTDYIEDFESSEVVVDSSQVAVDDQVSDRQRLMIVTEAVAALPPQCRKAFVMRKIDGLSYKEIARRLKLSESTVEKHVAAGLVRCMDTLTRLGHDPADFGRARVHAKPDKALRAKPPLQAFKHTPDR